MNSEHIAVESKLDYSNISTFVKSLIRLIPLTCVNAKSKATASSYLSIAQSKG